MILWSLAGIALLMVFVVIVFISWPQRAINDAQPSSAELFEERLQQLALARDTGELADDDFEQAAQELKAQFLLQQQQVTAKTYSWRLRLFIVLVITLSVSAIYLATGHYRQLQDWQLAKQQLPTYGERALLNKGEPLSEHEVDLFALALRTRLAEQGDDAVAWMLLGRIRMSQGMPEQAIDAFEKALAMTPDRTALLLSYSQALIVVGGDENLAKAGRSVARVLTREPDNTDALSLMALIAYEKGDEAEAIAAWQLLLKQLPDDDPRYAAVQKKLAELGAANDIPAQRKIIVNLFVDPALQQANPQASLFLFARAVDGSALPLAVQRIPLPAGEQQLILDEKMAMQPDWNLANADKVEVVARMSLSGTVEQRPGDLQTVSEVLTFDQAQIITTLRLEP